MKKILLIASKGGHAVQIARLYPSFTGHEITFISTYKKNPFPDKFTHYRYVIDSNFDEKINVLSSFWQLFFLIASLRPEVIVTTGAAPGLVGFIVGKLFCKKLIWIDSIANANELSLAGKIANSMTHHCYTQWKHLAKKNGPRYIGSVI